MDRATRLLMMVLDVDENERFGLPPLSPTPSPGFGLEGAASMREVAEGPGPSVLGRVGRGLDFGTIMAEFESSFTKSDGEVTVVSSLPLGVALPDKSLVSEQVEARLRGAVAFITRRSLLTQTTEKAQTRGGRAGAGVGTDYF